MSDDDRPIGSVLTRREALALLGAGGLSALAAGRGAAQTAGTPRSGTPRSGAAGKPVQTNETVPATQP